MSTLPASPMWAAYDDSAIWATGRTPEDALATFYRDAMADADGLATLATAMMTQRLAERIERFGFDAKCDTFDILPDGMLDIRV